MPPVYGVAEVTFSPESNKHDLAVAHRFLRKRSNAELIQIIAAPTVLIDWLKGFTGNHLGTKDQHVVVHLAKDELDRRGMLRTARAAAWASAFSAGCAIILAAGSLLAGDNKATSYARCQMTVLSTASPPQNLLSVCMRAAGYQDTCGSPPGTIPECFVAANLFLRLRDAIR